MRLIEWEGRLWEVFLKLEWRQEATFSLAWGRVEGLSVWVSLNIALPFGVLWLNYALEKVLTKKPGA